MRMTASQSKSKSTRIRAQTDADAIALLKGDHKEVSAMFEKFEGTRSADVKRNLVAMICQALTVHAQIEEEIFYPAAREALKKNGEDLLDEAEVEHGSLKDFIAELENASPEEELYDAKVKVLGEYTKHHVKEEENEIFPACRKSKMDLEAIGEELLQRKNELMSNGRNGRA